MNQIRNAWLVCPKPNPQASMRLFCFHYAGGSATIFRRWPENLPSNIEVCAIQLPGRGSHIMAPPLTSVEQVIDGLSTAIAPWLDKPFMFFGHSMGALISFELTRRLRAEHNTGPAQIFVSGRRAPQLPIHTSHHTLPELEFMSVIRSFNGTPKVILENAEMMQAMLPLVRADFMLCETYQYTAQLPLDSPIHALGGIKDPEVDREHLEAWSEQTTNAFKVQMFPGDHFFIQSCEAAVLQVVARSVYQLASAANSSYRSAAQPIA
jgi:medium-chain acyl-[acyl-carrier-protein] hydrolase